MFAFLGWLESTGLATWTRESPSLWAYPTILTLHTVGLAVVVGGSSVIALRLLGAGSRIPLTTLGSLYYSKVYEFVPCELCWYQRICVYPFAVILGIAAWRRDAGIRVYAIPVLAIGMVISAYHTWIQAYPPESGTSFCTADVPCTTRYVWEFGFVSLPFMALSAMVAMTVLLLVARPAARRSAIQE